MTFETLLVADDGAVRTVTINRPDKLNALNSRVIDELTSAFAHASAEASVRALVLTGSGEKAFVAGADISEMTGLTPLQLRDFSRRGQALMTAIERLGKPVVAAIDGFALGGGFELAMACHLRIAGETAKIGQPEVKLGLTPGFGGTQRLLRLAGRGAALELCLTGDTIDAARAHQLGLVTRVVPATEVASEAASVARKLAGFAPQALRGVIDAIAYGGESTLDQGLDYETQVFALLASSDDMREGTSAFLEKRKPAFKGS